MEIRQTPAAPPCTARRINRVCRHYFDDLQVRSEREYDCQSGTGVRRNEYLLRELIPLPAVRYPADVDVFAGSRACSDPGTRGSESDKMDNVRRG
jgi:hypothetical protein